MRICILIILICAFVSGCGVSPFKSTFLYRSYTEVYGPVKSFRYHEFKDYIETEKHGFTIATHTDTNINIAEHMETFYPTGMRKSLIWGRYDHKDSIDPKYVFIDTIQYFYSSINPRTVNLLIVRTSRDSIEMYGQYKRIGFRKIKNTLYIPDSTLKNEIVYHIDAQNRVKRIVQNYIQEHRYYVADKYTSSIIAHKNVSRIFYGKDGLRDSTIQIDKYEDRYGKHSDTTILLDKVLTADIHGNKVIYYNKIKSYNYLGTAKLVYEYYE